LYYRLLQFSGFLFFLFILGFTAYVQNPTDSALLNVVQGPTL